MIHRAILPWVSLCAFATAAAAQDVTGRIDLEVVSGSPLTRFVVVRVAFAESDRACPEEQGTLRITAGRLRKIRMLRPTDPKTASNWQATIRPTDDETQHYQIETANCRMDVDVRQQVRRDGSWTSLLVPRDTRPSVPPEERKELQRQFMEDLLAHKEPTPASRELTDRMRAAGQAISAMGSLGTGGSTTSIGFPFEGRPETCFEAVGDYRIERAGVEFSFLTGLPGDLNRFVIERIDLNDNQARLYFMRGDCRFQLTVSQSVARDDQWIALPLAPAPPGNRGPSRS